MKYKVLFLSLKHNMLYSYLVYANLNKILEIKIQKSEIKNWKSEFRYQKSEWPIHTRITVHYFINFICKIKDFWIFFLIIKI